MRYDNEREFEILVGKTLKAIYVPDSNDRVTFATEDGEEYVMNHDQDCCESVYVESIVGELNDLIGSPIVQAEESASSDDPVDVKRDSDSYVEDSQTWTFYRLATIKGSVVIRWYGSSNGYYSESVSFSKV
jgi:hypothetical protein